MEEQRREIKALLAEKARQEELHRATNFKVVCGLPAGARAPARKTLGCGPSLRPRLVSGENHRNP